MENGISTAPPLKQISPPKEDEEVHVLYLQRAVGSLHNLELPGQILCRSQHCSGNP